jgi:protein TonB
VGEVKVASGNVALTSAAVDAVRQWRYRPALLDGEPVQSEMSVAITFHLAN